MDVAAVAAQPGILKRRATMSAEWRRVDWSTLQGATHETLSSRYRRRVQEVPGFRDLPRQDHHRGLPAERTPGSKEVANPKEEPPEEAALGTAAKMLRVAAKQADSRRSLLSATPP